MTPIKTLALSALGIRFSDSATTGTRYEGLASRPASWIAVGLGALIVALLFDYRMLLKFSVAIYCVCLLPLVYLLFFGETIATVRSWPFSWVSQYTNGMYSEVTST